MTGCVAKVCLSLSFFSTTTSGKPIGDSFSFEWANYAFCMHAIALILSSLIMINANRRSKRMTMRSVRSFVWHARVQTDRTHSRYAIGISITTNCYYESYHRTIASNVCTANKQFDLHRSSYCSYSFFFLRSILVKCMPFPVHSIVSCVCHIKYKHFIIACLLSLLLLYYTLIYMFLYWMRDLGGWPTNRRVACLWLRSSEKRVKSWCLPTGSASHKDTMP